MIKKLFLQKKFVSIFFGLVLLSFASMAQVTITGTVSDDDKGLLEGVSITEKNTKNGTVTNASGAYSITVKSANAILVFEYLGKKSATVKLTGQNTVSVTLKSDASDLGAVTVTAGRKPTRKIETTTAVEIISAKQLKIIKPEGISEAITAAPGIYVNQSQGRRGGIVTRGFPDGGNPLGGLDYTAILIDGLPAFGSTGRIPEAGFGFDMNVDRVEVVRGSAATLFGRASAAGAINVISKTGGNTLGGSVRITNYNNVFTEGGNNFNYRVDYNLNGPITKDKSLRFNLGGWMLDDKGFKNTSFKDKGYQLRGNLDYTLPDNFGKLNFYFLNSNYIFQNLTDVPADLNTMKTAGNWKNYQTMQNFEDFYNVRYTVYESGSAPNAFPTRRVNGVDSISRTVRKAMEDNSYGKATHVGFSANLNFGGGFSFENRFRYQEIVSGTKYSFALPSFYKNNSVLRLLLDGDANDNDIINEARLKKYIKGEKVTHDLVLGAFLSYTTLNPTTYSFAHTVNPANADTLKFAPLAPPFVTAPWSGSVAFPRGSITRRGNYTESVSSIFVGDEIKINNKLTLNMGLRYDWMAINMSESKKPYDVRIARDESFKDWSGSFGINYMLKENSSVYANLNRAFRSPDYTAFTSLEWTSATNRTLIKAANGIDKNENIVSFEAGYRGGFGDFSFDVAGFNTKINNRLATIFQNGVATSVPFGSNKITGGEISVSYNSSVIKGLSIRSNVTFQKAVFTEFKVNIGKGGVFNANGTTIAATALNVDPAGNLYGQTLIDEGGGNYAIDLKGKQLPGIPSLIWNSSLNYFHKYFGLDFSSNYNGKRFADPTELIKFDNLITLNAGAFVRLPMKARQEIRLGVQVKNLSNNQSVQNIAGLGASDQTLGQKQKTPDWKFTSGTATDIWGQGYVQLPRRILITLGFDF
jgi:outer membrane receptor protein involved in Fe transport